MNPIDWLKALYGWIGVDHPKSSLLGAIILGAFIGGMVWKFASHEYHSKAGSEPVSAAPSTTTINKTTGAQSPIFNDNKGTVTIYDRPT